MEVWVFLHLYSCRFALCNQRDFKKKKSIQSSSDLTTITCSFLKFRGRGVERVEARFTFQCLKLMYFPLELKREATRPGVL